MSGNLCELWLDIRSNKSGDEIWFRQLTQFLFVRSHFVCVLDFLLAANTRAIKKSIRFLWVFVDEMSYWMKLWEEWIEYRQREKKWNSILIMNWSWRERVNEKMYTCRQEQWKECQRILSLVLILVLVLVVIQIHTNPIVVRLVCLFGTSNERHGVHYIAQLLMHDVKLRWRILSMRNSLH